MNGDNDYGKSHIIGEWEVKSQRDYITITNCPKGMILYLTTGQKLDKYWVKLALKSKLVIGKDDQLQFIDVSFLIEFLLPL